MTDLMDIDHTVEPSCVPEVLRVRISSGFDLKVCAWTVIVLLLVSLIGVQ
jgi:hypothetical protein